MVLAAEVGGQVTKVVPVVLFAGPHRPVRHNPESLSSPSSSFYRRLHSLIDGLVTTASIETYVLEGEMILMDRAGSDRGQPFVR